MEKVVLASEMHWKVERSEDEWFIIGQKSSSSQTEYKEIARFRHLFDLIYFLRDRV